MGSGFRSFASGEVLTSSNVQNYLMDQAVMSFASAAARDLAILVPEEGMLAYAQDTDAYSSYTNGAWGIIAFGASPIFARKTGDTTVNNSAAPANDPHLFAAVVANATYTFETFLIYDSVGATADFKNAFTSPAGSTLIWAPNALSSSATTRTDAIDMKQVNASGTSNTSGTVAGSSTLIISPKGILRTAGTAGTLQLQWAQGSATVENTVLHTDSWMRVERVA